MSNKKFYRYSTAGSRSLKTLKTAGEDELHGLLISYNFPYFFSADEIEYISNRKIDVCEKLIFVRNICSEIDNKRLEKYKNRDDKVHQRASKNADESKNKYQIDMLIFVLVCFVIILFIAH